MNKFENAYESFMTSLICEATTKIEHNQVNSIRKQLKKLGIEKDFYIRLPNGKQAGPFNKIRQVSNRAKTCKADCEIYNNEDKDVQSVFISLKDYAFRQFGGREDLFGGKIYKNMKDEANKKLLSNSFIRSRYNLIIKVFEKLDAVKKTKDRTIYDFKKLKNKIKGFRNPMIAFRIPDKDKDFFASCKFGFDTFTSNESGVNNVDLLIVGEPKIEKLSGNVVELTIDNEKSSIEWNSELYGNTKKNILLDRHAPYLCFIFDTNRHTFGDFINCRFVVWPEYKVKGWIHEKDINDFLNGNKDDE